MKDVVELQNKVWKKQQEVWDLEKKTRRMEMLAGFAEIDNQVLKAQLGTDTKKMMKGIKAEAQKKTAGLTLFVIAMNIILILSVIL